MNIVRSIFYPAQPSVVLFSEEKNRSHNNNSHIAHFLNGLNINNNRRTSLRYACIFTSSAFGCTHVRKQSTNDTVKRNVNVFSTTKWNEYKQTANYKPLYNRFFLRCPKELAAQKYPFHWMHTIIWIGSVKKKKFRSSVQWYVKLAEIQCDIERFLLLLFSYRQPPTKCSKVKRYHIVLRNHAYNEPMKYNSLTLWLFHKIHQPKLCVSFFIYSQIGDVRNYIILSHHRDIKSILFYFFQTTNILAPHWNYIKLYQFNYVHTTVRTLYAVKNVTVNLCILVFLRRLHLISLDSNGNGTLSHQIIKCLFCSNF